MKIGQVLLIVAVVGTGVAGALARSPERGFGSMADPVGSEPTLAEVRQLTERFRAWGLSNALHCVGPAP